LVILKNHYNLPGFCVEKTQDAFILVI